MDTSPRFPASVPDTIIAIPVRNEAERIEACLRAIDAQDGVRTGSLGLYLFLNNCTDGTDRLVTDLVQTISIPVRVRSVTFDGAHAGWARRAAMEAAAEWIGPDGTAGTILTSDADSRVPTDWVARNLAALDAGADAVAGRIQIDEAEWAALPKSLRARGKLEDAYSDLLTEMEARIDHDPHDPWPCHRTTIGATLAVRLSAYRLVGGMPMIALGEDGAFVAALLQHGLRVRHAKDVVVTVSGRLVGRAPGGVADTIRARCEVPDSLCDARMESVPRALYRYLWRRRLRRLHATGGLATTQTWFRKLSIPAAEAARIAKQPLVGLAVAEIERVSPRLVYRPLGPRQLPRHIRFATMVLAVLRSASSLRSRLRSAAPAASVLPETKAMAVDSGSN
ncbi:glycosyltransferase [Methylobacterium sp. 77]|uniref:glycosyltransferase n=1 Tax=Methylobacterium sp. 77 TaxID=1101192 RepID=UPI0006886D2E|nr:glycosyltransferase [Methylobacterium sp. 77]